MSVNSFHMMDLMLLLTFQDKICDCRQVPLQKLGECCTCEPGEYNPAQYAQDECPSICC